MARHVLALAEEAEAEAGPDGTREIDEVEAEPDAFVADKPEVLSADEALAEADEPEPQVVTPRHMRFAFG
jgi:hypothetical protein